MRKWTNIIILILALVAILFAFNYVSPRDNPQVPNRTINEELTRSIVDQMFPGSQYSIKDGRIYFSSQIKSNYQTLFLEQIQYGNFTGNNEYLAVLRAPEDVLAHAGGFYYIVVAVFDAETNKIKVPSQQFMADEGEISILKGKDRDCVLFLGSSTFQGWKEAIGGVFDVGKGYWEMTLPANSSFWKDHYAVYGNGRMVLYKRVIEPHNYETAIPPNHFEMERELIWDSQTRTFKGPVH